MALARGHWENHQPGPGIGAPLGTDAEIHDPYWAKAWSDGYTWVYDTDPYSWLTELPGSGGGGSPTPGQANPAVASDSPQGYVPIIFGRRRVKGQILIQTEMSPSFWQCILVLCEGEIATIGRVWCNGTEITNGVAGRAWALYSGTPAGTHNAYTDALADAGKLPPYTSASPELAFPNTAYLNIQIDASVFSVGSHVWSELVPGGGAPTFEVEVYGRKVYDHRDGGQSFGTPSTWLYTDTPTNAIRDILANSRWGLGYTIDDTSFDAAANICDAMVGSPSLKRFICNDLIQTYASVQTHLTQLLIACNGELYMGLNGLAIFIDVENAGSPVMTLDTATNFVNTKFESLSAKDSPTQVVITYQNLALDFKDDTIYIPKTLPGGTELRTASYTLGAITDATRAMRAGAYILNQNTVTPVRASGIVSQAGVILGRGAKVAVTTSDGPAAAPFLVQDAELIDGAYNVSLRQYDASVYSDTAIETSVPVPTILPIIPGEFVEDVTGLQVVASPPSCYWSPPRIYGTGFTPTLSGIYWHLDAGSAVFLGRLVHFVVAGPASAFVGPVQYSDDDSSWTSVSNYSWAFHWIPGVSGLTDKAVMDWTTPALPHRYWRVDALSAAVSAGSKFYDILIEIDRTVTQYEIHNGGPTYIAGASPGITDSIFSTLLTAPSVDSPADLSTMVTAGAGSGFIVPTVVARRSGGMPSPGLTRPTASAVGAPYISAQATVGFEQAGLSSNIDGVQRAGSTVTRDFEEWETAGSTPAVSGATTARAYFDGADLLLSKAAGAYAPIGAGGSSPLTTKGDVWGYDSADNRIPVGSDGKVLTADSGDPLGVSWQPGGAASSPLTTKGDLWGFDTVDDRVPVGSNGQILEADSTQALGVKWTTVPAGGAGISARVKSTAGGPQTFNSGSTVDVTGATVSFTPSLTGNHIIIFSFDVLAVALGTGEVFVGEVNIGGSADAVQANFDGTTADRVCISNQTVVSLTAGVAVTIKLTGRISGYSISSYNVFPTHTGFTIIGPANPGASGVPNVDGIGTAVTLVADGLVAITDNSPVAGDIKIGVADPVGITHGGTGQATATLGFDALSPMTLLGDLIYGSTSGTRLALAGNTTVTPKMLSQTGTGSVSAAPSWVDPTLTLVKRPGYIGRIIVISRALYYR